MSSDKDRGIRRIKQKRAKALKRQAREQRSASVAQTKAPTPPAGRPT